MVHREECIEVQLPEHARFPCVFVPHPTAHRRECSARDQYQTLPTVLPGESIVRAVAGPSSPAPREYFARWSSSEKLMAPAAGSRGRDARADTSAASSLLC